MGNNFKMLGRAYGCGYTVFYQALHIGEWGWKKKKKKKIALPNY